MKYIRLRVRNDGVVCLSVPYQAKVESAVQFMMTKWDWITDTRNKILSRPLAKEPEYLHGDSILLFGKAYKLEVIEVPYGANIVELHDDSIRIYVRENTSAEKRKKLILSFYAARLREKLKSMIEDWCVRLSESSVKWTIRDMKTEWGSCTKIRRTLRFSLELAKAADECIEYVVVHELSHLVVANHGPDFKALMDARLPDWTERKRRLNGRE